MLGRPSKTCKTYTAVSEYSKNAFTKLPFCKCKNKEQIWSTVSVEDPRDFETMSTAPKPNAGRCEMH